MKKNYVNIRLVPKTKRVSYATVPVQHTDYMGKWRRQGVLMVKGLNQRTKQWQNVILRIPRHIFNRFK